MCKLMEDYAEKRAREAAETAAREAAREAAAEKSVSVALRQYRTINIILSQCV